MKTERSEIEERIKQVITLFNPDGSNPRWWIGQPEVLKVLYDHYWKTLKNGLEVRRALGLTDREHFAIASFQHFGAVARGENL